MGEGLPKEGGKQSGMGKSDRESVKAVTSSLEADA